MTLTTLMNTSMIDTSIDSLFENDIKLKELKANIQTAIEKSQGISVFTPSSLEEAAHYIKSFKNLEKELDNIRAVLKKPFLDKGKEIDGFFKHLIASFESEKSRLEKEAIEWKRKQEMEARKRADAERRLAEEEAIRLAVQKEAELKAEAISKGQDPEKVKVEIPVVPEVIADEVKLSSKNSSGVTTTRTKKWELVDIDQVPREFLCVDERKVNLERAKYDFEAQSIIPGIKFTFIESIRG